VRNSREPVFNLATVMTKLLDAGLPLPAVLRAVTDAPRAVLGLPEPWPAADCAIRHATVFRITGVGPPGRRYVDAAADTAEPRQHLVPVATIRNEVSRPVPAPGGAAESVA
jgi:predicted amidohydrolase